MTPVNRRIVLAGTMAAGLMSRTAAARGKPDFQYLDACLRMRVSAGYFPGMSVRIGCRDRLLHEAHFGDGAPDRVLHVASAGKWVAAATIAALVDEGRLKWDDPARHFLPELTDIKGNARLTDLLSHTAGYPDYQPPQARRDDYQTLEESVRHIVPLPAVAAPGQIFQYGGLAMQIAGRMAELAAHQPFNEIFRTRIAQPLGMTRSGFSPVSSEPGFSPMLGGAFFTTVDDYGRFLAMLSQDGMFMGKRVLSAPSIRIMQDDHVGKAKVLKDDFVEPARAVRRSDIYGLGEWREEVDDQGRATLLSSPGWAGAYGWLDKRTDVWGVVLAKADVPIAAKDGYSTFLGSSLYAPMVRTAMRESSERGARRGVIPAGDARLYYEERGSGDPVILLHGHSLDRRMWDDQIAVLSRRYRVVRYDLRGYGRSSMPEEDKPFLHAEDLRTLMDQLHIPKARLVGLSLGGFVITDFLALYPEKVVRAVMAGGDLFDIKGPDEPWTDGEIAARRSEIAGLKKAGQWSYKREWYDQLMAGSGGGRERMRVPLWQMIDEWQMWQPLHVEPRLLLGHSVRERLRASKSTAPVLIVRGDKEKAGFAITDYLPQAQFSVLNDCGHLSNMDQPEAFNAAITRFLGSRT